MNKHIDSKILLVVSQSARMIAQLAKQSGYQTVAIDCFADSDTRLMTLATIQVSNLSLPHLVTAVRELKARFAISRVVYGSGFEGYPDSLSYLEREFGLIGNQSQLFWQLQHKDHFFAALEQLNICHPEVRFSMPLNTATQWLVKPMYSAGGQGIHFYASQISVHNNAHYWQQYIEGEVYSLLFLANQTSFVAIGYNQQFVNTLDDQPFIFSQIRSNAQLSLSIKAQVSDYLHRLLTVYPLQGLGSLDFIVQHQQAYLLEINPRIPASAQLYQSDLLTQHILACEIGSLPAVNPGTPFSAYKIIYSPHQLTISASIDWPDWVCDRPAPGAIIGKNQAICSIIAAVKQSDQLQALISERQSFVENLLHIGS